MTKKNVVLERVFVPKGKLIVKEGEFGNCAYLIQTGTVSVHVEQDGNQIELASLGLGDIFGELSLIFNEPRTASVTASEDTTLIMLTREVMRSKLQKSDPIVQGMVEMLTRRIVNANKVLAEKQSDFEDLTSTSRIIYQNILMSLDKNEQSAFQDAVLPKLDELLNAINSFQKERDD